MQVSVRHCRLALMIVLTFIAASITAQPTTAPLQLKLKDFAIWGGSAPADLAFSASQGVFIETSAVIDGHIGSNQSVAIQDNLSLQGGIYSGNRIVLSQFNYITGDVVANKQYTSFSGNVISAGAGSIFAGNVIGNGVVNINPGGGSQTSSIAGYVRVPAPFSLNYTGPTPINGIDTNVVLPALPIMPRNTPFDNSSGGVNITSSQILTPGVYKNMLLTGGQTITFAGPGTYVFLSINNGGINDFTFDFQGTSTGTFNIFVIGDAAMGKITAHMLNGSYPNRIYTEVHGNGSSNQGKAFEILGQAPNYSGTVGSNWVGAVWAPSGDIFVGTRYTSPLSGVTPTNVSGALWSGTRVSLEPAVTLIYQLPAAEPNFIDPYYPPPTGGKVDAGNNVIGAELLSLYQNPGTISSIPANEIFRINNGMVMIEVISKTPNDNTLLNQLFAAGLTQVVNNGPHTYVISGYFPIANLQALNTNSRVEYVRPLYPPLTNAGLTATQGDKTMRSDKVRELFALDGEGVKVGVLSDSYDAKSGAQHDVQEGDLPNDVQKLLDFPGRDEGRAMLQIVHDVAPKSKLAFRTGFYTAGDFANGIKELSNHNLAGGRCDILVDDITYITEPFLRDGVVANTVNEVASQGVTYFSSAGNFGERSYENVFNGVTSNLVPSPGTVHKFGSASTDIFQTLKLAKGSYTIVLQWSDDFHSLGSQGVQTDLDLYLVGSNGYTLFGFNRDNLYGDPLEVVAFTVTEETEAKLMIVNATGSSSVRFKYIIFRGNAQIMDYRSGSSTIVGHPNAEGCIAVGAMLYENIPQYTPVWPGVASFSSRGGTHTSTTANNFVVRNKPELIAPNGVNTTVDLGMPEGFSDGDNFPNFFGTSAAAPHAAAAAALVLQAKIKYDLQASVTPVEIRNILQNSAVKFPGQQGVFTYEGGYGYVQADAAVQQVANAKPVITSWEVVDPNTAPGSQPFQIKVKGNYLAANALIYFNGVAIQPTTISHDRTEAIATIPAIAAGANPPLQLFNPAKSPSGLDGGMSEAVYFFGGNKVPVVVKATNKMKKFGQENPAFDVEIFIDNVPIAQTNHTAAELKLENVNLTFGTHATAFSKVGFYGITPSRTVALDPANPADAALISAYIFSFQPGVLTIEKMPLKVTPNNQKLTYGEFPESVTYKYELGQTQGLSPALMDEIKALHKRHIPDNAVAVLNGFNTQSPALPVADLQNMSLMASFQAVRNARKYVLENGQLMAMVNSLSLNEFDRQRFLVDVSAQSLNLYKTNPAQSHMIPALPGAHARALLNIKSLANGQGKAALPNGQLQAMVNGQLLAMVNGQLMAMVNGQLQAMVNGVWVTAEDVVFQNGQLMAMVNGEWKAATNGQLQAMINGTLVTVEMSVLANGQLQAMVNGQSMAMVNGQLQAMVNGQLLAMVNGQLMAMVNGQLMPMVNGQLLAMVNGQLQAMVNGQLLAIVNGQLMAMVNGEIFVIESISLVNGQLQMMVNGQLLAMVNGQLMAMVNGQLQAIVNGQLLAMVNGQLTNLDITNPQLVNGQLQAMVNGQLMAMVNGQLMAMVNGQLQAIVNGDLVPVQNVRRLPNGQLQAMVNGIYIPLSNGQLQAMVNGQLMAMVNGQLMAIVNNELTFVVFQNGQLMALVNGQLQAMVNGQLMAMVNGQLTNVDNVSITNGQLMAMVNNEWLALVNGQLLAMVNGQLQAMVNNFDISGINNNANTAVLVDEADLTVQGGSIGGMLAMNMITGLNAGMQKLVPAAFVNENFEVTYGLGEVEIIAAPLFVKADDKTKMYGDANPTLTMSATGWAYGEDFANITKPSISTTATSASAAGEYPIVISGGNAANYSLILRNGKLLVTKAPLSITADLKYVNQGSPLPAFTSTIVGLKNNDAVSGIQYSASTVNTNVAGVYNNIPSLAAATYPNYQFSFTAGNLYVNAAGTGAKKVIPKFECVEINPVNGLHYAATFSYTNSNSTAIYVPAGSLNYLETTSNTYGNLPQVFEPGTHYFKINFNGNKMYWAVTTLGSEHKTAITSEASANSNRCSSTPPAAYLRQALSPSQLSGSEVSLYPNPAQRFLQVVFSGLPDTKSILLFDASGRMLPLKPFTPINERTVESDVSHLSKGIYFIKIRSGDNEKVLRFIKM